MTSNEFSQAQKTAAAELNAAREAYRVWAETIADSLLDGDLAWTDQAMETQDVLDEETTYGRRLKSNWTHASEVFLGTLTPFIQEPLFELDGRIGA